MRNKLMVTAAVAALIGCTTFAVAQEPNKGEPAKGGAQGQTHPGAPGGAMQHAQPAPGGAMQHQAPAGGAAQNQTAPGQHPSSVSQGEGHSKPTTGQGAQNNEPKPGANGQTEQNAQTQERNRTQENAQTQDHNGRTEENAQTQARPGETPESSHAAAPGNSRENTAEGKGAAGGRNVQVSEQQRTRIKDIIVRDHNAPRVAHVDFSVQIGVAVPRTVHFVALPTEIVEIVPEYRGFDYIVVGDQLLIIDPQSLEIVYILPA